MLAHHESGASNGPTEGLNLCVKRVKRLCGHGFKRLRVLLHAGRVTLPSRPRRPRIRTRSPHSNAIQAPYRSPTSRGRQGLLRSSLVNGRCE
ncbi:MAG: hypothetical protein LC808_02530 [Actinobacteria bacterium]|nr:hypothetical protein [Actinomycetota bacterium]